MELVFYLLKKTCTSNIEPRTQGSKKESFYEQPNVFMLPDKQSLSKAGKALHDSNGFPYRFCIAVDIKFTGLDSRNALSSVIHLLNI